MTFNMALNINYTIQGSINSNDLSLVLCQTNATGAEPLTPENTWSVLSLPRKFEQLFRSTA